MIKSNFNIFNLVFVFLGGVVLLFIVAPLAGIFINTHPANFMETIVDPEVSESIWLTLWTSMLATIVFSIMAIPLAYILARKNFKFKKIVTGIIDIPIIIPHSAAGIALLGIFSRNSFVGQIAGNFGITFVGSPLGIMLAMAFVSIPFLINAARNGFASVPENLEKAAMTLGASRTRVFFTISLPLAWRAILSGLILMWARGMSEFGAVIIIAYHPITTPVLIFERFGAYGLKYSTPIAAIFIAVCLLFFILFRFSARGNKNAQN